MNRKHALLQKPDENLVQKAKEIGGKVVLVLKNKILIITANVLEAETKLCLQI